MTALDVLKVCGVLVACSLLVLSFVAVAAVYARSMARRGFKREIIDEGIIVIGPLCIVLCLACLVVACGALISMALW